MAGPPLTPSAPPGFDCIRLAEQLLEHRFSQADLAPLFAAVPPGEAQATVERLIGAFHGAAGLLSVRSVIENRAPAGDTLGALTNGLAAAVGARLCRVLVADPWRGGFFMVNGDGSVDADTRAPAPGGTVGKVLCDGKSRIGSEVAPHAKLDVADAADDSVCSLLCVALWRDGAVAGAVQLFDKSAASFSDADRRLAETAAPYFVALLARAGLMPRGEDEPSAFRLIEQPRSGDDVSGRDLLLSKILAVANDVLDADRGFVFIHDAATGELYARQAEGFGGREVRIEDSLGLVGAAFRTGEIVNVADAYRDPRFYPGFDWHIGYRTRSVLCVPIFGNDGQRIGAVKLCNKRRGTFTAADERRLKGLAAHMGVTIEYATLFEHTLAIKSYTDSMLRSLSNGVLTADLAGVVTFVNQAAMRILRLADEDIVGRTLAEIFTGLNAWVVELIAEANSDNLERLLPNSEFYIEDDDAWVAANVTVVPLEDGKQTALGAMLVLEDLQREKELRRTMSRYLSNEVIDRLMLDPSGGLGGSSHEVTILFSDIRGFTSLTEQLGAGDTVAMLNEYFSFMEDVVTNRGGMIDKYIGDALMALFGSPFPTENDADNAVQTATDMFKVLKILNARRAVDDRGAIRIGVGIGTGPAVTGNIGSPKRMDFTVIGDAVNLASRTESATKIYGADILVCGTTWSRLKSPPRGRRLDVVRLRGQTRPTELWEILEHRPEISDQAIETYISGLSAYLAGEWGRAADRFAQVAADCPNDRAAALMTARCRQFLVSAPEPWDGVVDLD
ncbi:MAG TPA: adenylate/guanylate cyclase domain-containing protein [Stellaceae bacterium]|jgi:adenylate cyclase|nr:adenylate/guanylate cyclase domain-containing protein [Stellaceae bacterium]